MGKYLRAAGWAALLTAASAAVDARAADILAPPASDAQPWQFVDEVAGGVLAHDPMRTMEGGTYDATFEAFSTPIYYGHTGMALVDDLIAPRLNAGAAINTGGKTSFGYAGLAWRFDLVGPTFLDSEFGMAVNDGCIDPEHGCLAVGSKVTFHEEIGLGYRVTDHVDIIATAEHISHAGLFGSHNAGISVFGLRVGYRF